MRGAAGMSAPGSAVGANATSASASAGGGGATSAAARAKLITPPLMGRDPSLPSPSSAGGGGGVQPPASPMGGGGGGGGADGAAASASAVGEGSKPSAAGAGAGGAGGAGVVGVSGGAKKEDIVVTEEHFNLLYHPLALVTPTRQKTQCIFLSLKIEQLKREFNEWWSQAFAAKLAEIEKINEKLKRIKEIQEELKLDIAGAAAKHVAEKEAKAKADAAAAAAAQAGGSGDHKENKDGGGAAPPAAAAAAAAPAPAPPQPQPVQWRPAMSAEEYADHILKVSDDEVRAAKVMSAAERKEFEAAERERAARRAKEGTSVGCCVFVLFFPASPKHTVYSSLGC
jgi:hypothetical protein